MRKSLKVIVLSHIARKRVKAILLFDCLFLPAARLTPHIGISSAKQVCECR